MPPRGRSAGSWHREAVEHARDDASVCLEAGRQDGPAFPLGAPHWPDLWLWAESATLASRWPASAGHADEVPPEAGPPLAAPIPAPLPMALAGSRREGASAAFHSEGIQRTDTTAPVSRRSAHGRRMSMSERASLQRPLLCANATPRLSTSTKCLLCQLVGHLSLSARPLAKARISLR